MSEYLWLEDYDGQSTDELLALEDTHRLGSLTSAFATALCRKEETHGADALTRQEWVLMAIESWLREVNNGGFDQFFINSSVRFVRDIVEALRLIDCPQLASVTQRAIETLHLTNLTPEAIEEAIDDEDPARDELLDTYDQQVFDSPEPIEERLFAFIKRNREHICVPG